MDQRTHVWIAPHCDERDLADCGAGMHKQIEKHWGEGVGDVGAARVHISISFY